MTDVFRATELESSQFAEELLAPPMATSHRQTTSLALASFAIAASSRTVNEESIRVPGNPNRERPAGSSLTAEKSSPSSREA